MQTSPYNTFLESVGGEKLIFNNISGVMLRANEQVVSFLKGQPSVGPNPLKLKQLYDARFLVSDQQNELDAVTRNLREMREKTDILQYTLVMTYRCNLSCPYCYEDAIDERSGSMSEAIARQTIDHLKQQLVEHQAKKLSVTLYGGEPLLNYQTCLYVLRKAADYCEQTGRGFIGSLITNGVLLDDTKVKELSKYIQLAQITLEGGTDYHNSVRQTAGGKETFSIILSSIRRLVDAGIRVNIRIQVSPKSLSTLEDCFEILDKKGLLHHSGTNLYFFPIMNIGGVCSVKSFSCTERYYDSDMFQTLWNYSARYPVMAAPKPAPAWIAPYCSFVNKGAWIVDPAGLKYKCVSMVGKPEGQCGEIFDSVSNEKKETYRRRERQFIERSGVNLTECQKCEHLPICDGGCAYLAKESSGCMESSYCDMHKDSIKDHLRLLYDKKTGHSLSQK